MEVLQQNNYIFLQGNSTFQNLYNKQEDDENGVFHSSPISHSKSMTSLQSSSQSSPSSLLLSTPLTSSPSTSSTSLLSGSKSLPNSCSNTPVMAPVSWRKCCSLPRCLLCTNGTPRCLCMNHPSWTLILRVVFFSLSQLYPDKEFFNLKKEVYVYLNDHWDILSPNQNQSHNWRRQVQDALSHSRFFRSGRHTLRCNGYWQLKLLCNPWSYINSKQFETLKVDEPSSSSSSPSSSPINLPKEDHLSHISSPIEIAWRISSPNVNTSNSKKSNNNNNNNLNNNNNNNNNDNINSINNTLNRSVNNMNINNNNNNNNILNNKLMDIKQLLHNNNLNNNINNSNNNNNNNNNINEEEYNELSSPSSSNYQSDDTPSSPFTPQSSSKSLHFSALNALSNFSLSQITLPPPPKMVQPSSIAVDQQPDDKIYQMKSILNCTF